MTSSEIQPTLSDCGRFPDALPTAVVWSHLLLRPRLRAGAWVVDATAGNGHDTLFLARCALPGGRVFAFDIQVEAIDNASRLIAESGFAASLGREIEFFRAGHEDMAKHLPASCRGKLQAVMFNLGYLPGGDKSRVTQTSSTLAALCTASECLAEGGLITVVCYPGHAEGDKEARAVEAWASQLPDNHFEVQRIAFLNLLGSPPRCIAIRKRGRLKPH